MKHIKTPVSHNEQGCIGDANGVALVSAYGRGFDVGAMNEIAEAINAYDALVAQRDALYNAALAATNHFGALAGVAPPDERDAILGTKAEIDAALALVRREGEE